MKPGMILILLMAFMAGSSSGNQPVYEEYDEIIFVPCANETVDYWGVQRFRGDYTPGRVVNTQNHQVGEGIGRITGDIYDIVGRNLRVSSNKTALPANPEANGYLEIWILTISSENVLYEIHSLLNQNGESEQNIITEQECTVLG